VNLFEVGSYLGRKSDELSLWLLHTDLSEIFAIIFIVTPVIICFFCTWLVFLGWLISAIKDNKKEHIIFGLKFEKFQFKDIGYVIATSLILGVTIQGAIIPLLK